MGPVEAHLAQKIFLTLLRIGLFVEHENSVASNPRCSDSYPYSCCLDSNFGKSVESFQPEGYDGRKPSVMFTVNVQERSRQELGRSCRVMVRG